MVVLAFLFSGPYSLSPNLVEAQTADALLKAYAAKDTDSDGLPDWQESLYGTDATNPESAKAGVTDSEAVARGLVSLKFASDTSELNRTTGEDVPGTPVADTTLTAQFSQAFFKAYVDAGGQNMEAGDQQALLDSLIADFSVRAQKIVSSRYNQISVHTDATVTTEAYIAAIETTLRAHEVPEGSANPVLLMDAYIQKGDAKARPKLLALTASYGAVTKDLSDMHVPPALAGQHLILLQSFDTLARATKVVTEYEQDPMAVLGALAIYEPASKAIVSTLTSFASIILAHGEPTTGEPGALIVNFARSVQ
jgi:hypothetical protein